MPRGISIHVGLNKVDPAAYGGWDGALSGCENDAKDMKTIADGCGYESQIILTTTATSEAVICAIGQAAQQLTAGDHLLLTYSGHGGQVPDDNGDEDDAQDETWVLYDRMVSDDELYGLWSQFAAGVRIFVLSDSCHSGTVVRQYLARPRDAASAQSPKQVFYRQLAEANKGLKAPGIPQPTSKLKMIPGDVQAKAWDKQKSLYRTLQFLSGRPRDTPVGASLVLISGCQDNQLSMDGAGNGLFTEKLKETWDSGNFQGSHSAFHCAIRDKMPATQTPNYFATGAADQHFEDMRPFDLGTDSDLVSTPSTSDTSSSTGTTDASTGTSSTSDTTTTSAPPASISDPGVTGPATADETAAPSFTVDLGGNGYYIFEIADDEALFATPPSTNDAHYYGTWADSSQAARLTDTTFTIPAAEWAALVADATNLFYRVCTTSSATAGAWNDFHVSAVEPLKIVVPSKKRGGPPPARANRQKAGRGGHSSRDYI